MLLNTILRMREMYVQRGLHEEQLALAVADIAGPLRVSAAELLELEGRPAASPRQALQQVIADFAETGWDEVLASVSEARTSARLPAGTAGGVLLRLITLTGRMYDRLERIRENGRDESL